MGIAATGVLVSLVLAYLTQSPRYAARVGLSPRQVQVRLRAWTGIALALQLLAFGFFFAGVPLSAEPTAVLPTSPSPTITPTRETAGEIVGLTGADLTATAVALVSPTPTNTPPPTGTSASGAFGGPPGAATAESTAEAEASTAADDAETLTPSPAATATATLTPTPTSTPDRTLTSTPTHTATPTTTPTPTLTPTPIAGKTAVVTTTGGNLGVQRVPGGTVIAAVPNGGVVILLPGHANYGGNLWQEVRTVAGVRGWVPESALIYNEGE